MEISMKTEALTIHLSDLSSPGLKNIFGGGTKIAFIKRNWEFVIVFNV